MPPITNFDLQQHRLVSRSYLNHYIGDFLKELELPEGKSIGLPIISDVIAANCNLEPVFYTDKGLVLFEYFLFTQYKGNNLAKNVNNDILTLKVPTLQLKLLLIFNHLLVKERKRYQAGMKEVPTSRRKKLFP